MTYLKKQLFFYREISFCAFAAILSGCAVFSGMPEPVATSKAVFPADGWLLSPNALVKYNAELDPVAKRALRNEIIDARMAEIDKNFHNFERALYQEGIGSGIGTDWTLLALTAGTAISRVTNTKTALAGISTAIVGGSASFKKEALFDKTMPALMAQMQAERETVRVAIRTKESLPVADYTWYAAESELMQFEYAGSIPAAINAVAKDAGAKSSLAAGAMSNLNNASHASPASQPPSPPAIPVVPAAPAAPAAATSVAPTVPPTSAAPPTSAPAAKPAAAAKPPKPAPPGT